MSILMDEKNAGRQSRTSCTKAEKVRSFKMPKYMLRRGNKPVMILCIIPKRIRPVEVNYQGREVSSYLNSVKENHKACWHPLRIK